MTWTLFDRLADTYDEVIPFFATFGSQLVELLDPVPGTRLLDVGAGRGAIAAAAAARGCVVTAIDPAPRMIEHLAAAHPAVDARVMDAHHIDLPDAAYDVAACGFVIHIVSDPARVIDEMRRVVRPGGTVAFTTPTDCDDGGRWDRFQAIVREYRPRMVGPGRPGGDVDEAELLAAAGFTGIRDTKLEVHIPIESPDACWRFHMSHGFAAFVESLRPDDAAEFRELAIDELTRMRANGGIVMDRGAWVTLATVA